MQPKFRNCHWPSRRPFPTTVHSLDTEKGCVLAHVHLYPPLILVKCQDNGSVTTNQISAQSVQPFPIYGRADAPPPMSCVICTVAWSLSTHRIRSQSAYPLLSYSLATSSYIPSLCTCHVPQQLIRWMGVGSLHGRRDVATHQRGPFSIGPVVAEI